MLSGTAEYALRAVIRLAQNTDGQPVAVSTLARELGIPQNYLSKVFHALAQDGVLNSTRGKGGGFQLAVSPKRLSLLRVIRSIDGWLDKGRCVLGRARCSEDNPCPVHHKWKPVHEQIWQFMSDTTVADVMDTDEPTLNLPTVQ